MRLRFIITPHQRILTSETGCTLYSARMVGSSRHCSVAALAGRPMPPARPHLCCIAIIILHPTIIPSSIQQLHYNSPTTSYVTTSYTGQSTRSIELYFVFFTSQNIILILTNMDLMSFF